MTQELSNAGYRICPDHDISCPYYNINYFACTMYKETKCEPSEECSEYYDEEEEEEEDE